MQFDEDINKILHEAYFNSPYEKATGIKRQAIIAQEDYDEPSEDFDYDSIDDGIDQESNPELDAEQEYEKFQDEGDQFVQKIQSMSAMRGTKLRMQFGLHDITAQALESWLDAGAPSGKKGVDLLLDAFLNSKTGVMLQGDETMTYELQKVAYALAYVTGLKNEKLVEHEKEISARVARENQIDPEEVFEKRWSFHFDLDNSTGHPKKLSREEKASGISTKRSGKPLMSGERFRKILEGAQLKTKKQMDVQKPKQDQDMGDIDRARENLKNWKADSTKSTSHYMDI